MSGYRTFAIAGLGNMGSFLASEFLKLKSTGTIDSVTVLTRLVRLGFTSICTDLSTDSC